MPGVVSYFRQPGLADKARRPPKQVEFHNPVLNFFQNRFWRSMFPHDLDCSQRGPVNQGAREDAAELPTGRCPLARPARAADNYGWLDAGRSAVGRRWAKERPEHRCRSLPELSTTACTLCRDDRHRATIERSGRPAAGIIRAGVPCSGEVSHGQEDRFTNRESTRNRRHRTGVGHHRTGVRRCRGIISEQLSYQRSLHAGSNDAAGKSIVGPRSCTWCRTKGGCTREIACGWKTIPGPQGVPGPRSRFSAWPVAGRPSIHEEKSAAGGPAVVHLDHRWQRADHPAGAAVAGGARCHRAWHGADLQPRRYDRNVGADELAEASKYSTTRALGLHRDQTTGVDRIFAGNDQLGIFSGVYDARAAGRIRWEQTANWPCRLGNA